MITEDQLRTAVNSLRAVGKHPAIRGQQWAKTVLQVADGLENALPAKEHQPVKKDEPERIIEVVEETIEHDDDQ